MSVKDNRLRSPAGALQAMQKVQLDDREYPGPFMPTFFLNGKPLR